MAKTLITGGCGFVGSNLAETLIREGDEVVIYDSLSRQGTRFNLAWLNENHPGRFRLVQADVRDFATLAQTVNEGFDVVLHTAGQVAVTTSVEKPREDFEVNALGTFNVLEAVRKSGTNPALIFTSTNKVYGGIEDAVVSEIGGRYLYRDYPQGIPETQSLDFHSPYGCSKGAADQYVRDYARIYGLRTVVFRMSCQYGLRQFGCEDQGWVAHFTIAACLGRDVSIYGDGRQVRDILFIDDLVDAFKRAIGSIDQIKGQVFNIGGGAGNAMSLLELVAILERLSGRKIKTSFGPWRPGDQRVFIADVSRAEASFGWRPTINREKGVKLLYEWVDANRSLFA